MRFHLLRAGAILAVCVTPVGVLAQADGPQAESTELAEGAAAAEGEVDETFVFKTEEEEELEALSDEIMSEMALFTELFAVEPLTEEQEARLPQAEIMAGKMIPEGTFGPVLRDSMQPLFDVMQEAAVGEPRTRLAEVSGVEIDDLYDLEDDVAEETLAVFDPTYADRTRKTADLGMEMVEQMFVIMEPAFRDALARALTTRFDETEMGDLLEFFATPLGEKFAREAFFVQYDPQMIAAMEQVGPALVEVLPDMMAKAEEIEAELEDARSFSQLSEAERERVASALGKSVTELDALEPQEDTDMLDSEVDESVT
ncbi:MAG: DUF2059 domain-containing protein [Pseudomonadota bacterium]